jgi:hypothetical protein
MAELTMQEIVDAENALVLDEFAKLKRYGQGELRVSTRRNPQTGIVEIIYAGAHEKADLEKVRALYARARRERVTF